MFNIKSTGRPRFGVKQSGHRVSAFTLVELLVVIGIIAVLIGILLPALNGARRRAQQTKCLASMREIGLGFSMYAQTYKGFWPCAVHDAGNAAWPLPSGRSLRWQDRIIEFITGYKGIDSYVDIYAKIPNDVLRQSSVLWGCPAYQLQEGFNNINQQSQQVRSGYAMQVYPELPFASLNKNKPYIDASNTGRYYKAQEWKKPEQRMVIAEGLTHFISMSPVIRPGNSPGYLDGSVHKWFPFENTSLEANWSTVEFTIDGARHAPSGITKSQSYNQPFMNGLFCDGHAEPVSVKQAWQAICNPGGIDAHAWP